MGLNTSLASILRYWESIEYFTPQSLPDADPHSDFTPIYSVAPGGLFPWESRHPHQKRPINKGYGWKYTLYAVALDVAEIRNHLETIIGNEESATARDERPSVKAALYGLTIDRTGRCIEDSALCSTCGWAYSQVLLHGPEGLTQSPLNFEDFHTLFRDYYETNFAGEQITHAVASRLSRALLKRLQLPENVYNQSVLVIKAQSVKLSEDDLADEKEREIRAESRNETGEGPDSQETPDESMSEEATSPIDLLNSMFLGELNMIASEVEKGSYGLALKQYLGGMPVTHTDLRDGPSIAWHQLKPSLFPVGRWPGKGRHPLVFSQQVAVNLAFRTLETGGLMSVNGPPGTGKTTLLKDVVAGIIVQRAMAMASFADPNDAFESPKTGWKVEKYDRRIANLAPSLQGFGIAVASSNNSAVENLSLEFPRAAEIEPAWTESVSPFNDIADQLLGEDAWRLVAAKLGKKQNRKAFVSTFWFDKKTPAPESKLLSPGVATIIKESSLTLHDWKAVVSRFKDAVDHESALRQVRDRLHAGIGRTFKLNDTLNKTLQELQDVEFQQGVYAELYKEQKITVSRIEYFVFESQSHHKARLDKAPHKVILSIGRFIKIERVERWLDAVASSKSQLNDLKRQLELAQISLNATVTCQNKFASQEARLTALARELREQIRAITKEEARYKECHASSFPDLASYFNDPKEKELSAPFADDEWNEARVNVLLAAMDLHDAFLQVAKKPVMANLRAAISLIDGSAPQNIDPSDARNAWDTLFMVVPMVSTTFASFHRLFTHLKAESLGWLLIDEAGQAAPQQAAGAIWRSKRVLVVGDPKQLKAINTVPFSLQDCLRQPWKVKEQWLPSRTSVQVLADQASQYGSRIGKQWVGAPLLVHRRCSDPMFSLSNAIAYRHSMVSGKPKMKTDSSLESQWIDVVATENQQHWIPEEGKAVVCQLRLLKKAGVKNSDVFLISPFRTVVYQLQTLAKMSEFDGIQAGTIHTVQGKESRVVILVLGGNPNKEGAKQWASEEPNLLNVAASRAKEYLYIVGNREAWSQYPYFDEAARLLPRVRHAQNACQPIGIEEECHD